MSIWRLLNHTHHLSAWSSCGVLLILISIPLTSAFTSNDSDLWAWTRAHSLFHSSLKPGTSVPNTILFKYYKKKVNTESELWNNSIKPLDPPHEWGILAPSWSPNWPHTLHNMAGMCRLLTGKGGKFTEWP